MSNDERAKGNGVKSPPVNSHNVRRRRLWQRQPNDHVAAKATSGEKATSVNEMSVKSNVSSQSNESNKTNQTDQVVGQVKPVKSSHSE